jgi:hypothetical protein
MNVSPAIVLRRARPLLLAAAAVLVWSACSGGGSDSGSGGPSADESYSDGTVTITVEKLDTGLLKGTATAEAKGGRTVSAISVTAKDPKGADWGVLAFPEGIGSASASEFFEVQLQELARGDKLEITATVTFKAEGGDEVERLAVDHWPP